MQYFLLALSEQTFLSSLKKSKYILNIDYYVHFQSSAYNVSQCCHQLHPFIEKTFPPQVCSCLKFVQLTLFWKRLAMLKPPETTTLQDSESLWKFTLTPSVLLSEAIFHTICWKSPGSACRAQKSATTMYSTCSVLELLMLSGLN